MKMNLKKGFTLIELLVVVAIIGILASVVLASLNTARAKGADAAIKANLDNMRAQAAIVYDNATPNSYGASNTCVVATGGGISGTCVGIAADATTVSALKQAAAQSGGNVYLTSTSGGDVYAISSNLKAVATTSWCVDSGGKSEQVGAVASALTVCP